VEEYIRGIEVKEGAHIREITMKEGAHICGLKKKRSRIVGKSDENLI
jgi:hypothetical protein